MKNLAMAMGLTVATALSMGSAAAVDVRTLHIQSLADEQSGGTTRVKVSHEGIEVDEKFTEEELKDRDLLENRLAALPEDKRNKIIDMLQRASDGNLMFNFDFDPELHKEMIFLTDEFHREHADKLRDMDVLTEEMEARTEEMELRAKELEEKAREMAGKIEQHVEFVTAGVDDGFIIEMNQDDDGKVMIIKEIETPSMSNHIVRMLESSKLTDEEKQAIQDALDKADEK
ncbi:hypothetical protein L2750_10920 [Shewanella submarina]|uniref:Uncharacterized protein n=1 Tax=Shewanella submarina TaxID=2016376 RepID=A0ABV7GB03_9GAMM|nr:hypothetical protein [Shewanella submarina]MCL1037662.1 hypothetical protein [Shewanella submarina]